MTKSLISMEQLQDQEHVTSNDLRQNLLSLKSELEKRLEKIESALQHLPQETSDPRIYKYRNITERGRTQ